MTEPELEPCMACNSNDVSLKKYKWGSSAGFFVQCSKCLNDYPSKDDQSEEQAIAAWNRRV